MLTPIITLPEGAVNDILGYVSQIFTDLSPIILLLVGVALACAVVGVLFRLFVK